MLAKVFGTANERELKRLAPKVERINSLEAEIQKLSDADLRAKTDEFRRRIRKSLENQLGADVVRDTKPSQLRKYAVGVDVESEGSEALTSSVGDKYKGALQDTLDEELRQAFAGSRDAGKRVLNMRHFDVQLIGGMVLHQGKISEMKTGEGKTLVATLPVYLNALAGKGVHVVTVNDYLARRDAEWMGQVYGFLGMNVGVIVHGLSDDERRAAYGADITYGTNNEFGFDYLRDNMKYRLDDMVQRPFAYAIVDEVDSILIDEARTPLIISGPAEDSSELYRSV